ncbi:MAG: YwmB family TATA-box binding protein [Firmicutes bacterium]|nr:YwmB family TATA-box binding protein [Bacillota bacterium]
MKKLLLIASIGIFAFVFLTNGFVGLTSAHKGDYTFYIEDSFTARTGYTAHDFVGVSPWRAQYEKLKLKNVVGESVIFQGTEEDIEELIKTMRVRVIYKESKNGAESIYGFTNRIKNSVEVNGKKVNVQFALRGTTVTVGSPVILGAF